MSSYIDSKGEFTDVDHPWCPPGYVSFNLADRKLHWPLWRLAHERSATHPTFAAALKKAIEHKGFEPPTVCEQCRAPAMVRTETGARCLDCGYQESFG